MQALPAYKGASVATIRKMIGWETEENFANLLRVVDYGFCKKGGTYSWWWLRSPYAGGGHVFLYVHDNGVWGGKNTVASAGVSPGFCL